jgi:hypothetical protein
LPKDEAHYERDDVVEVLVTPHILGAARRRADYRDLGRAMRVASKTR